MVTSSRAKPSRKLSAEELLQFHGAPALAAITDTRFEEAKKLARPDDYEALLAAVGAPPERVIGYVKGRREALVAIARPYVSSKCAYASEYVFVDLQTHRVASRRVLCLSSPFTDFSGLLSGGPALAYLVNRGAGTQSSPPGVAVLVRDGTWNDIKDPEIEALACDHDGRNVGALRIARTGKAFLEVRSADWSKVEWKSELASPCRQLLGSRIVWAWDGSAVAGLVRGSTDSDPVLNVFDAKSGALLALAPIPKGLSDNAALWLGRCDSAFDPNSVFGLEETGPNPGTASNRADSQSHLP